MNGRVALIAGLALAQAVAPPARAVVVATGTFAGEARGSCSGTSTNYVCDLRFNSALTCFEAYGGTNSGTGGCSVSHSNANAFRTRGTATRAADVVVSCTTNAPNPRVGDPPQPTLMVTSPSVGSVDVVLSPVTYNGTAASGSGTFAGRRQALGYTIVVEGTFGTSFGCSNQQDSVVVRGTYYIIA